MNKKVVAIVPAAGSGRRFGSGSNKAFTALNGKPVVVWSLQALEEAKGISEIIPVFKDSDMRLGWDLIERFKIAKVKRIAAGGKERQDSVYRGLCLIGDKADIVLIHDGVRPLVEKFLIEELIKKLKGFDGVIAGVPPKDTIKEAAAGIVRKTLTRESLWAIQTPQVFKYESLMKAYEKAMRMKLYVTDDAALVEKYGGKIKIIMGSYTNLKITTPEDLNMAKCFLKEKGAIKNI